MNVNDYLKQIPMHPGLPTSELVEMRGRTFHGFRKIEERSLNRELNDPIESKAGQERIRSLFARVVEEILEAMEPAVNPLHRQEEWIDALNFAMGMLFIPTAYGSESTLPDMFAEYTSEAALHFAVMGQRSRLSDKDLLMNVLWGMNELLGKLRNRSWQVNTQLPYLDHQVLVQAVYEVFACAVIACGSYDHFQRLFLAKDKVLQFRLATKY